MIMGVGSGFRVAVALIEAKTEFNIAAGGLLGSTINLGFVEFDRV